MEDRRLVVPSFEAHGLVASDVRKNGVMITIQGDQIINLQAIVVRQSQRIDELEQRVTALESSKP